MTRLLFVYGSLRRGQDNPEAHHLAASSRWVAKAHVRGTLGQLHGFPALTPGRSGRVDGELVLIDDALWPWLDQHEGVGEPGWYRRELVVALDERGDPRSAWTYVASDSPQPL